MNEIAILLLFAMQIYLAFQIDKLNQRWRKLSKFTIKIADSFLRYTKNETH